MAFWREIVCLANSRKWSGRCVVGKDLANDRLGQWIRPVSRRDYGQLSLADMCFEKGGVPQLLDILAVPLLRHVPQFHQTENYLVDDQRQWRRVGRMEPSSLASLCDPVTSLWPNGHHSSNGRNDRAPEHIVKGQVGDSLVLIKPDRLSILVAQKTKRKVRAEFGFRGEDYRLKVTHPEIENEYRDRRNGLYPVEKEDVYLCVGLGEPHRQYCYKLVAAVIGLF